MNVLDVKNSTNQFAMGSIESLLQFGELVCDLYQDEWIGPWMPLVVRVAAAVFVGWFVWEIGKVEYQRRRNRD